MTHVACMPGIHRNANGTPASMINFVTANNTPHVRTVGPIVARHKEQALSGTMDETQQL